MPVSLRYIVLVGWMALIFAFSATPDLKAVDIAQRVGVLPHVLGPAIAHVLELVLRKSTHMLGFGVLACLAHFALAGTFPRWNRVRLVAAAWGFTVLYAMTDEWHQTFVPGRSGRLFDVGIDAAGAALMLLAWRRQSKRVGTTCGRHC